MRDPKRINKVLSAIRNYWATHPDTRLCQLLSSAAIFSGWKDKDLFYLEDDAILRGLDKMSGMFSGQNLE